MRRPLLLAAVATLTAVAAWAQPQYAPWARPDVARGPGGDVQAKRQPCERPRASVTAGTTLRLDTDSLNAFRQNALASPAETAAGTVVLRGDTLVYTARDTAGGRRDTVRLRSCLDDTGAECVDREVVILVARRGLRRDTTIALDGGAVVEFDVDFPTAGAACASITAVGGYDYADFRELRFADFAPGPRLRYASARGGGADAFEVVICDAFGACDTTAVTFEIAGARATLPFFDDFSYAGPAPDPARWIEDAVFVNDAFGQNAPSYGVATFDGVDRGGRNYGQGYREVDRLTTVPMDLGGLAGREVYVKYYLQLGGRGQAPEFEDNFFTQFRRADGAWATVERAQGSRTSRADSTFVHVAIPVTDPAYFHADFQVRFQMRANGAGLFDVWNLDYVRVEETPDPSAAFRDIALASRPPSPLAPYTAVPYRQFAGRPSLLRDRLPVAVYNHFAQPNNVSSSEVVVTDSFGIALLTAGLLTGQQFNLEPGLTRVENAIPPAPLEAYRASAAALGPDGARRLTLAYRLGIDQDQIRLPGVLRNDTATQTAVIADDFAYDDGTAELGLFNTRAGDRIVVRYRSFVDDTLRGLRLAFPNLSPADANRQLINLQVYVGDLGDRDREPDYEEVLVRPYFPASANDTLQAFTTYDLVDALGAPLALPIPAGDFYVGWQQAVDAGEPVQVGVDLNNDNADAIFSEYGGGWQRLTDILRRFRGSLMIRPVFGPKPPGTTSAVAEAPAQRLRVYPNPSPDGRVTLDAGGTDLGGATYRLFDLTGRLAGAGRLGSGATVSLALDLRPGVYVLGVQLPDGGTRVERLVVR